MESKSFNAGLITEKFSNLQAELIDLYSENGCDEFADKVGSVVEKSAESDIIKVVFAGRWSAGKSSIIKALTGNNDIKTGSDVTTQECADYKWGSFLLTDTPGLDNNESHDEIAERAIKESDMIVYCITSDCFSSTAINDFKRLAFE